MLPHYISVKEVSKRFSSGKASQVEALQNISIDVSQGELFGLIGPDGAGKSTLFRILATLMLPDKGSATIAGLDIIKDFKTLRNMVGYMPGRFSLYQDLSVEENINFFATLFNTSVEENYDFIKDIYSYIEPFKKRRAGNLSGGMKQKLALSCALIHKPQVLFLDEPTTGVDPVSRKEFWDMLQKLKNDGITIIASTPYMDEARLCDRICLIQKGKIMECDIPERIRKNFRWDLRAVSASNMFHLLGDLRKYSHCESCYSFGEYQHISLLPNSSDEDLFLYLQKAGHQNIEIHKLEPSIEDCFMDLVRKGENNES
ncbi:MAG: ABC transporter ATP-binding protein [Bacteroidales bacterium]